MAHNILNPIYLVNELIGSIWLFLALVSIAFFGIASTKKFSFQITLMIYVFILLTFGLVFEGWQTWIPFIVVIVGILGGYVYARFLKK